MIGRLLLWAALLPAIAQGWAKAAENESQSAGQPAGKSGEDAKRPDAARNPSAAEEAAGSRRPAPRNPRVMFITMHGCEACSRELARLRRPGGDFEAICGAGPLLGMDAPPDADRCVVCAELWESERTT